MKGQMLSGGIVILNVSWPTFPTVCIRTSIVRPEALNKACFLIAGIDSDSLPYYVCTAVAMNASGDPVPCYIDENVSTKVIDIVRSYTGLVN